MRRWRYHHQPKTEALGSPRPDGKPWLTKEQILDNTLCLVDKARVQRTSEEDANKCMLCWLASKIDDDINPFDHWEETPSTEYRHPVHRRNPHFPLKEVVRPCSSRSCDELAVRLFGGLDDWEPEDGSYDLALEYWKRITSQPWIDIAEEPPFSIDEDIVFERDKQGFRDVSMLPSAIRHFEWTRRYKNWDLTEYLQFIHEKTVQILPAVDKPVTQLDIFMPADSFREGRDGDEEGWSVELRPENGRIETVPGVYFPWLNEWRKKRKREWLYIWKRLVVWLYLDHLDAVEKSEARHARFERLAASIEAFLKQEAPEPKDDIDLRETIPERELVGIDEAIDIVINKILVDDHRLICPKRNPIPGSPGETTTDLTGGITTDQILVAAFLRRYQSNPNTTRDSPDASATKTENPTTNARK